MATKLDSSISLTGLKNWILTLLFTMPSLSNQLLAKERIRRQKKAVLVFELSPVLSFPFTRCFGVIGLTGPPEYAPGVHLSYYGCLP